MRIPVCLLVASWLELFCVGIDLHENSDESKKDSSWHGNEIGRRVPVVLHHHHGHLRHHHVHHWGPFFEHEDGYNSTTSGMLAIAVPLGSTTYLNCRVAMLQDKTVMWLKKSHDRVRLLTVGANTYSGDPRFEVKFQYPNNWRLFINPVQREDEGMYECQVSTYPPRVLVTNLTVLAPDMKVIDEHGHTVHDRYYKTGSIIDLTCRVMALPGTSPPHITWSKDGGRLPKKIKTSVLKEKEVGVISSHLVVPRAEKSDSGTYSCSISKLSSVFVDVSVLNGEKHAAVQHDTWENNGAIKIYGKLLLCIITSYIIVM